MRRILLSFLFSIPLWAQPSIRTELRHGILRAAVRHAETGEAVSDEDPAQPGETLVLKATGLADGPMVYVGDSLVEASLTDEESVQFVLPPNVGGSFAEISLLAGEARSEAATFPVAAADGVQLTAAEVQDLVSSAALAVDDPRLAVVVVDRAGRPLAIFQRPQASDAEVEKALSLARTGAFFSSEGTPLSSRTVRSISRPNFPEGIPNQPAGALFGIENTNRGCEWNTLFLPNKTAPRPLNAGGTGFSAGIASVPGGLPVFRNGTTVIGGIGAAGPPDDNLAEFAAVQAAVSSGFFVKLPLPPPGAVFIDGFRLPYVAQTAQAAGAQPAPALDGTFQLGPLNGNAAPEEWLVGPAGSATLSADEVRSIVQNAVERANKTRAAIRLPLGSRTRMAIAVAGLEGNILGLYRMPDSTIFSIDVAITKARNVVYFSGPDRDPQDLPGVPLGTAVTNRTIGFGSQPYFPSGIFNSMPGPFRELYQFDLEHPCAQGLQPENRNQSGVVFFPGSAPLYKNGALVGGLGVSGDGVEQDDYVTAGGAQGYEPPEALRADQIFIRGVRLPYWKFPRNPEQ